MFPSSDIPSVLSSGIHCSKEHRSRNIILNCIQPAIVRNSEDTCFVNIPGSQLPIVGAWLTSGPGGGPLTKYLGFPLFCNFSRGLPPPRDGVLSKDLTNGNFHELLIWPKITGKIDHYIKISPSCFLLQFWLNDFRFSPGWKERGAGFKIHPIKN